MISFVDRAVVAVVLDSLSSSGIAVYEPMPTG